ncbi:MAG: ABC transporter permease, partial [Cobetia crustatorum]
MSALNRGLLGSITSLGRSSIEVIAAVGRAGILLVQAGIGIPSREGIGLWVRQMHFVGVLSLAIVLVSGLFIGMVLALQGYTILVGFGAEEALGQMVSLSLLRELAPVVAAEIGLMKATEQLTSMEMIGVDPLKRIVAPRLWAGFVSLPLLTIGFSVVGIWGGKLVGVDWLGIYEGAYWSSMQSNVDFIGEVMNGVVKS